MFAEDTPEVVDAALDHLQRTTAVLLLQPWFTDGSSHSGVVEICRVHTDPVITGGFSQRYLILREKRDESWQSDLRVSPCIESTSSRNYSDRSQGPGSPRTPGTERTSAGNMIGVIGTKTK